MNRTMNRTECGLGTESGYGTWPGTGAPTSTAYYRREVPDGNGVPEAWAGGWETEAVRPRLTRHRLRRRRTRTAATLLTGASLALGLAALRPAFATADATARPVCAPTQPG
jgi:hypothetical protein